MQLLKQATSHPLHEVEYVDLSNQEIGTMNVMYTHTHTHAHTHKETHTHTCTYIRTDTDTHNTNTGLMVQLGIQVGAFAGVDMHVGRSIYTRTCINYLVCKLLKMTSVTYFLHQHKHPIYVPLL